MPNVTVVIDYQTDFVTGELGFADAKKLDENIAEAVMSAAKHGEDIFETRDIHPKGYENTLEGKYLPIHHCVPGTLGIKTFGKTGEVLDKVGRTIIHKESFGSLELASNLQSLDRQYKWVYGKGIETIRFHGVVSYLCLISNIIIVKAALPNAEIVVNKKTCAGADRELHEAALKVLEAMFVKVIDE